MPDKPEIPADPLAFIKDCVINGRIFWTYHLNMRLASRNIARGAIVYSTDNYELIESYPDDKYLPSYLVLTVWDREALHVLFATDVEERNVRVVTAYRPDPREWQPGVRKRRAP